MAHPVGQSLQSHDQGSLSQPADMVTVLVGTEHHQFIVSESLLTTYSDSFRETLTPPSEESLSKIIVVEDVDRETFKLFVHWLYNQRWPWRGDDAELLWMWDRDADEGMRKLGVLVNIWIFCYNYDIHLLKNRAMTQMFDHVETFARAPPTIDMVNNAYENLPAGVPLYEFFADSYCKFADSSTWEDVMDSGWPPEFIQLMLEQYAGYANTEDGNAPDSACHYHEHDDDDEDTHCNSDWRKEEQAEIKREKWEKDEEARERAAMAQQTAKNTGNAVH